MICSTSIPRSSTFCERPCNSQYSHEIRKDVNHQRGLREKRPEAPDESEFYRSSGWSDYLSVCCAETANKSPVTKRLLFDYAPILSTSCSRVQFPFPVGHDATPTLQSSSQNACPVLICAAIFVYRPRTSNPCIARRARFEGRSFAGTLIPLAQLLTTAECFGKLSDSIRTTIRTQSRFFPRWSGDNLKAPEIAKVYPCSFFDGKCDVHAT
jgi:hypothetical protein